MSADNTLEAITARIKEQIEKNPEAFLQTQRDLYLAVLPAFGEQLGKFGDEKRDISELYKSFALLVAQMMFELFQKTLPMDNYQARVDNFNKLMIVISTACIGALEQTRVMHEGSQETKQ